MDRLKAAAVATLFTLSTTAAFAATVSDDEGMTVTLPEPARRIVTLSPHATDLVVAAGATDRLVAVAAFSELPPPWDHLPRIGGAGAIDRESLMAWRPDLVIAWPSGNRPNDLAWLRKSDIPLFASEPSTLARVAAAIRAIGKLADTSATADRAATAFEKGLVVPCRAMTRQPAFVTVWDRPAMTVGGRHWLNEVLALAGFANTMGGIDLGVFAVSSEAAAAAAGAFPISLMRHFDGSAADRLADLLSRPGPRLAEAVQRLCALRQQE
ncbi:MAG: ABC transporter substrate-binding protein [Gammaproteobacteria bacterium]|nr:ABC transporter substrate-binding protein [Gammaproteobacteria bacterium]